MIRGSIFLLFLAMAGCSQSSEVPNGKLTRWVGQPPDMVSRVAADVLLELRFHVERDVHWKGGGDIEAKETPPGKRAVAIHFKEVEAGHTLVTVDPGGEKPFGEQLLDRIVLRVGAESGRVPPYMRGFAEGYFEGSLEDAVAAVEEALGQVDASVTDRAVQASNARVEGFSSDETLYEVTIVVTKPGTLSIGFTASSDRKEAADRRAEQVKSEFAKALAAQR
jgi:hypothetical protein